ncbi:T-box transcription factor TBX3-like isoform X2 [Nylanderia fulva]|nr:T-box transcription factor TBX3-like isoform X2 [Nylanderia fulva]XP_029164422.1 T-box transcription factor TBX3-like isoform X2 [Nylanderia fulva]
MTPKYESPMTPLQVPFPHTDANIPIDLQLQLRRQHFERMSLAHITDEESYLRMNMMMSPHTRSTLPPGVRVELKNRELWNKFHAEHTEMIITKTGRRMFPSVQVSVKGLNKNSQYYAVLEIGLASDRRHKYCGNGEGNDNAEKRNENKSNIRGWSSAGQAESQSPFERRMFFHPENPATGEYWMQNSISFSKLKLTNNVSDPGNNVVLTSMHKYIPKIWLISCIKPAKTLNELFSYPASVFTFKETEFIAVTAYQNGNITKLKIDNNPFAKGFRETGSSRCKRKHNQLSQSEDESNTDSSESSPGANNLDDLKKSPKVPKIANSDDDDDKQSIAEDQRLTATPESTDHESSEVSSTFYRPWLNTRAKPLEPIPQVSMVPSAPSLSEVRYIKWFRSNLTYYLQSLSLVEQEACLNYYRCYYPILLPDFYVRRL